MKRRNDFQRVSQAAAKSGWLIPTGFILLSVLPFVGATHRLVELLGGAQITKENARFFAAPLPVIVHAISSIVYFILGAFQFSPSLRSTRPQWHRVAGRILISSALISALSGMWMALFYPPLFGDGTVISCIRLSVGGAIILFICLGFAAIKRREFLAHRAWMMRAYALAIGAGTQPFTLAPMMLIPGPFGEVGYTLGLAAGWIVNCAIAEWLIRRKRSNHDPLIALPIG